MKVSFIAHWNEGPESGVFKKIVSQVELWQTAGIAPTLIVFSSSNKEIFWRRHLPDQVNFKFYKYKYFSRIGVWWSIMQFLRKTSPDIVYSRLDLIPSLLFIQRTIPLIIEINSNDLQEYRSRSFLVRTIYRIFRFFIFKRSSGLVFVSKELAIQDAMNPSVRPYIVIGNGIDLSKISQFVRPENRSPRIVFIGTEGQAWHGLDKIMALSKTKKNWQFDIIGFNSSRLSDVPSNVTVYGKMSYEEYVSILKSADLAFGTLALHRKGMNEASPLKVREYLAHGIPTIIGYKDTDFDDDEHFLLKIPNNESNVMANQDEIVKFVELCRSIRVPREAILHLDQGKKEEERIKFFRTFVNV